MTSPGYSRVRQGEHKALHEEPDAIVEMLSGIVRSDSMELNNDPRFFTGNVLDKRLSAFTALTLCASLFMGTALQQVIGMNKDVDLVSFDGQMQGVAFLMMNFVVFANMLAVYVSVAQTFFTYRLMTAGPTGFEIASTFYLDPNIAFWRHAAAMLMLVSLPTFIISLAFRMMVKIDSELPKQEGADQGIHPVRWRPFGYSMAGIITFALWVGFSMVLFYVNAKYLGVFKRNYMRAKEQERPLLDRVEMLSMNSGRLQC